jgi:uncharacterized membrane protein HdeD (DUF308 family)
MAVPDHEGFNLGAGIVRQARGFGWSLLSALVALMAGTVLLWNPFQSLVTLPSGVVILTYVLIDYFIVDGILMIILAITHRRELSGKWEWILVNGVIDLILAGIMISGLPGTLFWALGLLVGIDMVFGCASSSPSRWRRARRGLVAKRGHRHWMPGLSSHQV